MSSAPNPPEAASRWTPKGQATRARIVESAADLMHLQGVAATSTEEILNAAEVSNSQLYHYFEDKDDLTRAVIAFQVERVLRLQETLLADLDSFAGLEAWRDAMVRLASRTHGRGGCPIGSLASELSDVDERAQIALRQGLERWEAAIRRGLRAMRDRGELRPESDPDELALATLASLQGGLLLAQARRDAAPVQTSLDAALAHIRTFAR